MYQRHMQLKQHYKQQTTIYQITMQKKLMLALLQLMLALLQPIPQVLHTKGYLQKFLLYGSQILYT